MQDPLISILTPFKNTAEYLPECLDSILNQTYQNWELLIIDDHSTDLSFSLVKQYTEKDKRIKLFKNAGHGIIDALRLAYKKAQGELVTRMDSDDIMRPEKLETLSQLLLKYGKQHIATGPVHYFAKNGVGEGFKSYEAWLNRLIKEGNNYAEIYKECVIPSPSWMLYKEDLDTIDAFNPERYPEDYDLAFRCYENKIKCIPCNTVLHDWRDYSSRASRTHEHYAENGFLDIKLHYFLKLDYDSSRPLAVWGAGNKGKTIVKMLIKYNVPFYWICDNPKKIGKDIYEQRLLAFNYLEELENPQSIITVANSDAQIEIKHYLDTEDMASMKDYYFFC